MFQTTNQLAMLAPSQNHVFHMSRLKLKSPARIRGKSPANLQGCIALHSRDPWVGPLEILRKTCSNENTSGKHLGGFHEWRSPKSSIYDFPCSINHPTIEDFSWLWKPALCPSCWGPLWGHVQPNRTASNWNDPTWHPMDATSWKHSK